MLPARLPVYPARVRPSVPANAVPCIPPVRHPRPVAVRRWRAVLEWGHVPVGRRVPVVCWVLPVLRLRAQHHAQALGPVLPHAVPDSVIKVRAASRKGR